MPCIVKEACKLHSMIMFSMRQLGSQESVSLRPSQEPRDIKLYSLAGRDAEAESEARQAADAFGADEAEQQGASQPPINMSSIRMHLLLLPLLMARNVESVVCS